MFKSGLKFRSIIFALSITDLKLRYRSSILGVFWSFLEPLLILSILLVVFTSILKNNIPNFSIFLLVGIIQFQMFSRSTTISAESILNRAGIVSSIRIPKNIFPISATLTAFYMMCLEFIVLAVFMAGLKFVPPTTIVFFPVLILLLFILCLGISIPLSILNIHYRDVRSIWTIIIQAAFFLTPIFYKLEFLPENIRNIIQFSPLTQIVNMSHQVILENKLPDLYWFLYLVISISAIFLIGMVIYKKYELNVVERL